MNLAQRSESAHQSTSPGQCDDNLHEQAAQPELTERPTETTTSSSHQQHNATRPTTNMSDRGLEIHTTVIATNGNDLLPETLSGAEGAGDTEIATHVLRALPAQKPAQSHSGNTARPRIKPASISFEDLAENLRIQRHLDQRQCALQRKRRALQKTIALSARLHRINSWIRDGLVEISKHADPGAFIRVHQHTQDLVDLAYSQWNHDLHTQESLGSVIPIFGIANTFDAFLPRLTSNAQNDLMILISQLRSNPKFLLERFRTLSHSQITRLSTFPRFEDVSESVLHSLQGRGRVSQQRFKRVVSFSQKLEEYATSFERSNPLSLLLFNIYGTDHDLAGPENQLRISTWSTVCAELLMTCDEAYQAILPQVLNSFASLHDWRVKDGVELVLMDILQRGAFLLDLASEFEKSAVGSYDPFSTEQAQEFFLLAVLDLFKVLTQSDGGFPLGALQFASAVLGKLPSEQYQSQFRGDFFSRWYLERYLRIVISYPENENMLLKFHISKDARNYILFPLWSKIDVMVTDAFSLSPIQSVPDEFQDYVFTMIDTLEPSIPEDPYKNSSSLPPVEFLNAPTITICPSEMVLVLEALTPQAIQGSGIDPVLTSSTSAFHAERDRFGRLRRELLLVIEPGSSASDVHPSQEQWLHLGIDQTGQPVQLHPFSDQSEETILGIEDSLDLAQKAALRVCNEEMLVSTSSSTNYRTNFSFSWSLEHAFRDMIRSTKASSNPMASLYWEHAQAALYKNYPLSRFTQDDSAVFRNIVAASQQIQATKVTQCSMLEADLSKLEDVVFRIKSTVAQFIERFEDLRLKLWYSLDVLSSKVYEDAKNITAALNNMALSILRTGSASASINNRRPMSRRSTTSSLWEQSLEDAASMLKAPPEQGGPKKLADPQIEITKKWLQRSNVDNFCRGEERIHRFCMEVVTLSKKLVGESLVDSPVLWSSKLFTREQGHYDAHIPSVFSAPASTRPASVMSETFSTTLRLSRPIYRSNESTRMTLFDGGNSPPQRSLHGAPGGRISRDILPPDLASSIGSPQPSYSATTAESISTFWSPLPSNTRSMTSASNYSRPASTYNDVSLSKFTDTAKDKSKFLDRTQKTLICLLLSDLGCPVWSLGSETDAWLDTARCASNVDHRLRQRSVTENLVGRGINVTTEAILRRQPRLVRSISASSLRGTNNEAILDATIDTAKNEAKMPDSVRSAYDRHLQCLEQLLLKLSQQVDPIEKLAIVEDFYNVAIMHMQKSELAAASNGRPEQAIDLQADSRRNSVDSPRHGSWSHRVRTQSIERSPPVNLPTELNIVQHIKSCLTRLRPKTLFRDLQYIAAFVPSDMTDKTTRGEAFLRLGLAALNYKDEVCRTMVDIADSSLVRNESGIVEYSDTTEQSAAKAIEYVMLAAKEGNAKAQRQTAMLYLSHPHLLPIISQPLSLSSKIFREHMAWQHQGATSHDNFGTLCLALHWMQQAADGDDDVARQKLAERKVKISFL